MLKREDNKLSKTVSFGLALAVLGGIQQFLPQLLPSVPDEFHGGLTAVIGIAVIVLRYLTTQPLATKK